MTQVQPSNDLASQWCLDPAVVFLNHGSFGACTDEVIDYQRGLVRQLEQNPVQFYVRDLEPMLDQARAALAEFLNTQAENLAWVPNATTGVNAVLRSLTFKRGDELLVTNHEYNACRNVLEFVARRDGATIKTIDIPFPLSGPAAVVDAVIQSLSTRTRLLLIDHVTSQTGLILPLPEIAEALRARDIPVLVDGAHAPGMIDLDLEKLGVDYYTGNCHKWLCAPKGAGFLFVTPQRQQQIRPPVISHGANSIREDRSRFLIEFDWPGTWDPTAVLSIPVALKQMGQLLKGGWPAVRDANRRMALYGREIICQALGVPAPCPDEMIGSLASIRLPDSSGPKPTSQLYGDPLQQDLLDRWHIEVPIIPWPEHPRRLLRISAQLYNRREHYQLLGEALKTLFGGPR